MPELKALFFDVGGVLLSNAWDREQRREATVEFMLDTKDFEERHELVVSAFETGKITLEEYLNNTLFCRTCSFTRDAFRNFMFTQSKPNNDVLELARQLSSTGRFFMATLNNESRELNQYRIEKFGLRSIFEVFFTSCYLGVQKPDMTIYRRALDMSQVPPAQCLFVDDRALNLERAQSLGMQTVQCVNGAQLREDLQKLGLPLS